MKQFTARNPATMNSTCIEKVGPDDWERLSECWLSYVVTEPMHSTAGFDRVRDRKPLLKILQNMVKPNSPHYVILDKDSKVVGCLLSEIVRPHGFPESEERIECRGWEGTDLPDDVISKVIYMETLFEEFEKKESDELFRKHGIDKGLLLNILYVQENCRGRGYANLLTRAMLEEASRLQIPLVCAVATSSYSIQLFDHLGFEMQGKIEYNENFKYYSLLSEDMRKVHTKGVFMSKMIQSKIG